MSVACVFLTHFRPSLNFREPRNRFSEDPCYQYLFGIFTRNYSLIMSPQPTIPTPPPTKDPLPQSKESGGKMPPRKTWLWFLGLLMFNYFLMSTLYPDPESPITVP